MVDIRRVISVNSFDALRVAAEPLLQALAAGKSETSKVIFQHLSFILKIQNGTRELLG